MACLKLSVLVPNFAVDSSDGCVIHTCESSCVSGAGRSDGVGRRGRRREVFRNGRRRDRAHARQPQGVARRRACVCALCVCVFHVPDGTYVCVCVLHVSDSTRVRVCVCVRVFVTFATSCLTSILRRPTRYVTYVMPCTRKRTRDIKHVTSRADHHVSVRIKWRVWLTVVAVGWGCSRLTSR